MCKQMDVEFLGKIPLDPRVAYSCDSGKPFVLNNDTPAAQSVRDIVDKIVAKLQ